MAEDPSTWGEAERVVAEVLRRRHERELTYMRNGDFGAGYSTPFEIVKALRDAGLVE